jgi:hypothetical protein
VVTWYIFPYLVCLDQEKSGNPVPNSPKLVGCDFKWNKRFLVNHFCSVRGCKAALNPDTLSDLVISNLLTLSSGSNWTRSKSYLPAHGFLTAAWWASFLKKKKFYRNCLYAISNLFFYTALVLALPKPEWVMHGERWALSHSAKQQESKGFQTIGRRSGGHRLWIHLLLFKKNLKFWMGM